MEGVYDDSIKDSPSVSKSYCQTTLMLEKALNSCVESILNGVSDDAFVEVYKDCYKGFKKKDDVHKPSLSGSSAEAKKYRKQFNTMVTQNISEVINETLLTAMDSKLRELKELEKEQADSTCKWRPPSNAFKHMIPFDTVSKMEEKNEIESLVKKERDTIDLLKIRLTQKRSKANELHQILEDQLKEIEKAMVVPV